jgi:hypothetical protein
MLHNAFMSEPEGTSAESQRNLTTIVRRRPSRGTLLLVELAGIVLLGTIVVGLYSSRIAATPEAFDLLSHRSWSLIGFAIVIGAASTATVQMLKQFFPLRAALQRQWVIEWIGDRCAVEALWADWLIRQTIPEERSSAEAISRAQRTAAAEELETALLGGFARGDLRRVFDLAVEHLCAQVSSAADLALSQPDQYAELLLALAGPAKLTSIDMLSPPVDVIDGRIQRRSVKPRNDESFALVAEGTRAGIDLLQISVGQRWRRTVRAAAVLLSGLFGAFGALLVNESVSTRLLYTLAALVFGGFFAWVIRDLTAIAERLRR